MRSSSSRANSSEPSPGRKNKSQSQREYRSKEMDGFSELRDTLLLVDPFGTPLGRDATRHQLLITAAQKLRNLADENEKLVLQLSAMPTTTAEMREPAMGIPHRIAAPASVACSSTQGYGSEHLLSTSVPHLRCYENSTPGWSQNPVPYYGHGHQPCDMSLGHIPQVADMRHFY